MTRPAYERLKLRLEAVSKRVRGTRGLLGFDGTVDVICHPVESRHGPGQNYEAFRSMASFGERVVAADGKSAIVELVERQRKIGGNGPIMAGALASVGMAVDYVGTLGDEQPDPAYEEFATRVAVRCLAPPAITHALEFPNGKLMLAELSSYQAMDSSTLRDRIGATGMKEMLESAQLVGLLNWSCLPGFESMLEWMRFEVLPMVEANPERVVFFDLADPSMRSPDDLKSVLEVISGFSKHGRVVLGMNLNEAQHVAGALGLESPGDDPVSLRTALAGIRASLGIDLALGHATSFAAFAGNASGEMIEGPYTTAPMITTGAGDHFNAGFCLGLVGGLEATDALTLGVVIAGYYVRHARAPRFDELPDFLQSIDP